MIKTYHCQLKPNKNKYTNLLNIFNSLQEVSKYFFEKQTIINSANYNDIYRQLRTNFPNVKSKLIQSLMQEYKTRKHRPKQAINIPIVINQDFDLQFFKNKHFSAFVRFFKVNYPLKGLYGINNIKDKKIKQITIKYNSKSKIFHTFFQIEIPASACASGNTTLGLDCNTKNICLSNGKFYSLKKFIHKKLEYRKHKQKGKLKNYTKDTIHKLTSKISKDLLSQGIKVLYLEDLTNIRNSASKKNKTSKGKKLNYIINNCFPFHMFQTFLEYKCLFLGIEVIYLKPHNTSKRCSKCSSLNTSRPKQSEFICLDCRHALHADLNAARNISKGISFTNEQLTNPAQRTA